MNKATKLRIQYEHIYIEPFFDYPWYGEDEEEGGFNRGWADAMRFASLPKAKRKKMLASKKAKLFRIEFLFNGCGKWRDSQLRWFKTEEQARNQFVDFFLALRERDRSLSQVLANCSKVRIMQGCKTVFNGDLQQVCCLGQTAYEKDREEQKARWPQSATTEKEAK